MDRPPRSTIPSQIRRLKKREAGVRPPRKGRTKREAVEAAPLDGGIVTPAKALEKIETWFNSRGWRPFPFQLEAWRARLSGASGLIHVPTGAGKTYASFLGALAYSMSHDSVGTGPRILYVTPLKAVSRDIRLALEEATIALAPQFQVEDRTGDTKQSQRRRQRLGAPEVLVTTPESLELLLTYDDHAKWFSNLETVILDEWHECLSSKRGSLLELTLTRLRALRPELATWAITATIANPEEAALVATGGSGEKPVVVKATMERPIEITSLIPPRLDTFPWAGHLGLRLLDPLLDRLDPKISTLMFTNTRSQAERWFQAITEKRPEWRERMALHHGSLDREERERVEAGLKSGEITLVVCTSSLDLGVDFGPVERVVQIGSPKGIARLIQRAGRSAHRPGETANLLFVPTHALELVEIEAARSAIRIGSVETRRPLHKPFDVLAQHLVTRGLGGGFTREEIAKEVRSAWSYRDLSEEEIDEALAYVIEGGLALQAYPAYRKIVIEGDVFKVVDSRIARLHKMSIGTIDSDARVRIKFQRGREIGLVDESFITRLKPGDRFLFGGRTLEFIRMNNLDAIVKLSIRAASVVPRWMGGKLPYSAPLSNAVRETFSRESENHAEPSPEHEALKPIFDAQSRLSRIPGKDELLIETTTTRDGTHLFVFPFEGRSLHDSLGALLAWRLARKIGMTLAVSTNDTGLEILSTEPFDFEHLLDGIFSPKHATRELEEALNLSQMAKQKFREVARVAGLLHPGHPSARKDSRQLQVSASLLFDVLTRYEPDHPLLRQALDQARREALEEDRLVTVLDRLSRSRIIYSRTTRPTPLAFPLIVERMGARLSSESLADRIEKLKSQWSRE